MSLYLINFKIALGLPQLKQYMTASNYFLLKRESNSSSKTRNNAKEG